MLRDVSFLSEHLATDRTREWSVASVDAAVIVQLSFGAELLRTRVAVQRLLTGVDPLMNHQLRFARIRLVADVTPVWPVTYTSTSH